MAIKKQILTKRVQTHSPESAAMVNAVKRAMKLTAKLNKLSFDDTEIVRAIFSELTGQKIDIYQPRLHHLRYGWR